MLYKRYLVVICGALLLAATHASAQPFVPPAQPMQPLRGPGQNQGSPAVGPNGTYYALVPGTTSTPETPATDLMAIALPSTSTTRLAPLWTATNLSGELGPVLPGANTVYLVQTVVSGSGRSATSTTSVLLFSAPSGSTQGLTNVTPAGTIDDIEVRTINNVDYLYIYTTTTSSSTSNNTTTITTTRTLTIYSQTGAKLGSLSL
jgi:hypothetical protein